MKFAIVTIIGAFALIATVVLAGFIMLLPAFLAMLLLGGLHASYAFVPAMGFWNVWKALWLTYIVGSAFYNHNTNTQSN